MICESIECFFVQWFDITSPLVGQVSGGDHVGSRFGKQLFVIVDVELSELVSKHGGGWSMISLV